MTGPVRRWEEAYILLTKVHSPHYGRLGKSYRLSSFATSTAHGDTHATRPSAMHNPPFGARDTAPGMHTQGILLVCSPCVSGGGLGSGTFTSGGAGRDVPRSDISGMREGGMGMFGETGKGTGMGTGTGMERVPGWEQEWVRRKERERGWVKEKGRQKEIEP
ncbi:hypothetical protein BDQ17DRAFT_552311 [Cyathus striatus]|nr:hypothetical protein BDQ17DRAFT_552311 [Cyathus striatus]